MATSKAQKQKNYIECLKTKDRAAYLESGQKWKKKKDETANNITICLCKKNRSRKAVKKVNFHLINKLRAGHKASSSLLDEVKIS